MTEYENVEEMTFEQSIDALEALVKRLEDGGLEDGERRIRKIMETADGSVREEEFEIN